MPLRSPTDDTNQPYPVGSPSPAAAGEGVGGRGFRMTVDTEAARTPAAAGRIETAGRTRRWPSGRVILGRLLAMALGILVPLLLLEASLRILGPWPPGNYDTGAYLVRHQDLGH